MFTAAVFSLAIGPFYLAFCLLTNLFSAGWKALWLRIPLFLLIWFLAVALNLIHWLGFLIDELVFFRYRRVAIDRPIFILGVPRSGTTFLQRVLADDDQLTTLTTWECLLAPSITQRYLLRFLGKLFRPFSSLGSTVEKRLLGKMDDIHAIRLDAPEEDFLLLWPLQACVLAILLFPNTGHFWRLGEFAQVMPPWYRRMVMRFYHRCLQKHLYFHGTDKRLLSKNPSFTGMIASLKIAFPDARIIACCRDPIEAVPSQLSSLRPGLTSSGYREIPPAFQSRLLSMLHHYYEEIVEKVNRNQVLLVEMHRLNRDLGGTLRRVYNYAEVPLSVTVENRIEEDSQQARNYKSAHAYHLEEFGLSEQEINNRYGTVWGKVSSFNFL